MDHLTDAYIHSRVLFDMDERKQILKKTKGICACCGKKLTWQTMTVDHMIPLSRGGSNMLHNLYPLCESCNTAKSDFLYVPSDFYLAMDAQKGKDTYGRDFEDFFSKIFLDYPIEKYPLISPAVLALFCPPQINRKVAYIPQFVVKTAYIGKYLKEEMEAVTGLNTNLVKANLRSFCDADPEAPVAIYATSHLTSLKYQIVFAVLYDRSRKQLNVYIPWKDCTRSGAGGVTYYFTRALLDNIVKLMHEPIRTIKILSDVGNDPFDYFDYSFHGLEKLPFPMVAICPKRGGDRISEGSETMFKYIYLIDPVSSQADEDREFEWIYQEREKALAIYQENQQKKNGSWDYEKDMGDK